MNTKEITSIVIATITIVVSIISWIEVQHEKLASKADLLNVQVSVEDIETQQELLATKSDLDFMYVEMQLGINDIRLRSFERRGLDSLDETEKRIYEGLKESTKELEKRRQ